MALDPHRESPMHFDSRLFLALTFLSTAALADPPDVRGDNRMDNRPVTGEPARTPSKPAAVQGDQRFIEAASQAGIAEVKLSELALTRTQNDAVKTFAQMMVDDHTRAGNELKSTVGTLRKVNMPSEAVDENT